MQHHRRNKFLQFRGIPRAGPLTRPGEGTGNPSVDGSEGEESVARWCRIPSWDSLISMELDE